MYNADTPGRAELPSSKQLLKSTLLSMIAATVILLAVVLPAEYAIDPTGVGRILGLTEMGEIKAQLSKEAEADRAADPRLNNPPTPATDRRSGIIDAILAQFVIGPASAQTAPDPRTDEMTVTLKPNEGAEIKLKMKKGAVATFSWTVEGGIVNCDTHGEPDTAPNSAHNYKRDRNVSADEGTLEAAFDGNHGWFWRNRSRQDVTVRLRTQGAYADIQRIL